MHTAELKLVLQGFWYDWQTVEMSLTSNSDLVSVTGLKADTKYYVRIGASADESK